MMSLFWGISNNLLPVAIATWKGVSMQIGLIWMCIFSIPFPYFKIEFRILSTYLHFITFPWIHTSYERTYIVIKSENKTPYSFPNSQMICLASSILNWATIVVFHIFAHHIRTIRIHPKLFKPSAIKLLRCLYPKFLENTTFAISMMYYTIRN